MKRVNDYLRMLLLLVAVFAIAEGGLFLRELRNIAYETAPLIVEAKALVSKTDDRLDGTFRNLNAILVQAGLVAARIEDLSRNMDAVAIKQGEYWATVQEKTLQSLGRLNSSADALVALLTRTDLSLNAKLLPEATETLGAAGASLETLNNSLQEASERANAGLDDIHRLLADPAWSASLDEIQTTTEHVAGIAGQLEEASRQMPSIAASLEKISRTSSRWRLPVILSGVISAISRAFF